MMDGKVKRVILSDQIVVRVVSVGRSVVVGTIVVIGEDRHWTGMEPTRSLPPIPLLEHTSRCLQLLQ